jgi:hypothetical protein
VKKVREALAAMEDGGTGETGVKANARSIRGQHLQTSDTCEAALR